MKKRLIRGAYPLIILVMALLLPLSSFENFETMSIVSGENILKTTGTIMGLNPDDGFGWNASGVGDVNGDGFDDILVGAPFVDGPLGNWWDMNWTYRRSLTFNNSAQTEVLVNFPVLVTLNQTNFDYSKAKSDGSDLRFIDSDDTTILNYHIEDWNPNGDSYVWVNVNNIAASSSSDFVYLYYGNPKASDIRNVEGTYDGYFAGVWHLNETSGTHFDATSNNNNGAPVGGITQDAQGRIDGANDFDGSDDYIEIDSVTTDLDTTFTISFWMRAASTSDAGLVGFHNSGGGNIWRIEMVGTYAAIEDNQGSVVISDGNWHYIVGMAEGSKSILYVDGELERDNIPETPNLIDSDLASIGQEYDTGPSPGDHFDGIIDEVRISNISRSSDWISAQYLSMTGGFINYGVEETNNQDRGAAYLFFGYSGINTNNIDASLANVTIHGSSAFDHFGWSLSGAGDLNADGFDDIIIGAPGYDVNQGRAYIFHGRATPAWSSVLDADSDADTILTGENNQDRFGHSVSGVGDVDKDNYFDSWQFRKKITIQASEVTADLTDFPVLIHTKDPDLVRAARIDGLDIVFTQSDGKTLLDFEFERYNGTTGELVAWVRIPFLSSTVNTEIYMYYGNSASQDHSNPEGVWSNGYVGIWHLNETGGDAQDSTSYGTSGLVSGSVTQGATGQIDGAYNFDPSSSPNVDMGNPSDGHLDFGTGSFTFSTWVNVSASTGTWQAVVGKRGSSSNPGYLLYTTTDASVYRFTINDGTDTVDSAQISLTFDTWTYLVGVIDRSDNNLHVYKDGSEVGIGTDITLVDSVSNSQFFQLSRNAVDGLLDEVRVSSGVRTASWISTEFNNQNDTSSFYLISPQEILPSNWFYRKQISIDPGKVAGDVTDFPVLIDIIDPDLAHRARPDGFDIVFTQADGKTKLDHEVIKFEKSTGELSVWVKVPFISSLTNTNIYMYYGNSDSSNLENASGVWSNGYEGVWHLDETAGNVLDSTSYNLEATFPASASRGIDGQIGYAYRFYGSTGELNFQDPADGHLDFGINSFSFSLWVNSTVITNYQDIIWKGARSGGSPGYCFYRRSIANGGTVSIAMGDSGGRVQNDFSIPEQTWIYIVGVADRGTDLLHAYLDGVEQGSGIDTSSVGSVDSNNDFKIADNGDPFNGTVDEVRVSRAVRSADWVMTEYNNQVDPNSFYAVGSEEIVTQNWYHYKPITIHSSQVIADLSDFPVLIEITDSDLMEKARNDGSDIVFTRADGKTKLDHEIESYDRKTGDLVAWVRVPFLSASSDTLIYMYYGNPEIPNQQNVEGVWKNGYVGVYHMDENIGDIINSASQTNNGTRVNFPTQTIGHIGYAQKFAGLGADDLFNLGNLGLADGVNENLTMSFWANINYTLTEDWGKIISKRNDVDSDYVYHIGFDDLSAKRLGMVMNSDSSWSIPVDNDVWIYVVATFDGTFKKIYLNTTEILSDADSAGPITSSNADVSIGSRLTSQNIGGLLDEVRLSKAVRSPVWIATEFNNQKDMASFITVGSELGIGKNYDVLVGAPGYSSEKGRAYLFVGGDSFSGEILASDAKSIFNGNAQGDRFGHVVTGNGNINTFGFDDVIISAPGVNGNDGAVYAYYGVNPMPLILNTANSNVEIAGSSGFELGFSLSNVDDLNDDGFDDIIVGSPKNSGDTGAAYVFFGNESMNPYLTIMDADVTMFGEAVGDKFGYSISKAKDMNGDGINDLAVGAPYHDDGAKLNSGSIYIFEGGAPMDGTSDWTIKGENDDDHFGWTLSHAGDITQDNLNYLIVGAPHNDDGGFNSGKAYLITATYKPVITNIIASPPTQIMGGNVNISCSVTAPSGIDTVWVNITLPGGGYINQSMIFDTGDTWFFDQVYVQEGAYQFVIWANGTFSDWSQSGIFQFTIFNQPPSLSLEQVNPLNGFVDSSFNFTVTYTDPDNQNPDTITVNITGYGVYDLFELNPLDMDYTDGKQYYLEILGFSPGQYTLHFAANDTSGYWAETGLLQFDVVNRAPMLSSASVNPASGNIDDDYNFSVIYTDLDNNSPNVITVNISGVSIYNLIEVDPLDLDSTDGKSYYYNTSGFAIGQYQFKFAANDSLGDWIESSLLQFDVGNRRPTLSFDSVYPQTGYHEDHFNFTVTYSDSDNHAPNLITVNITNYGIYNLMEVDPFDTNYIDGKEYYFNSTLPSGSYSFHFAAEDIMGYWALETMEISDPVVSPRPGILDIDDYTREFGDALFLNATLVDNLGNPISGEDVTFYIDLNQNGIFEPQEFIGIATSSGIGEVSYYYPSMISRGIYNYTAISSDPGNYTVASDEAYITINPKPATLTAATVAVDAGKTAFLNATLTDYLGYPVVNEQVALYLDKNRNGFYEPSEAIVTVSTTVNGLATINYYIGLAPENYGFRAKYEGSDNYLVTEVLGLVTVQSTDNIPPTIVGTVPNQIKEEDSLPWTLDLTPYEDDIEDFGLDLTWYLEGVDNSLYSVTGENSSNDVLTFIPKPDVFGNDEVILWLVDSEGKRDSQILWINITPVNDPPYFDPEPPDLFVHFDDPLNPDDDPSPWDFTFYVHDIETPLEDLVISTSQPTVDLGEGYAEVDGLSVTFHYPEHRNGEAILVFLTLSDGTDSVQTMIVVNVTSDWVPELIEELPDIVLMENSTLYNAFDLDDFFSDRDQDMIFFTSGNDHVIITINENNSVDITAPPQWSGTEMVTFRARDPTGAIAEDTILVTVLEVNDGPEIAGIPNLVVHYDYAYSFDLSPYIYDPDNLTSELVVWTSESTQYIRIQQNNNLGLLINYPELLNGMIVPVTIYVSDGLETDSITIDITVSQYFPPELITNVPDVYFDEDTVLINAFVLSDYFLDVDSSILFYSNGSKNINVTINKDLSVDFSAPENWYGSEFVTFRATDSEGALAEDKILVYVVPVNDRPTIKSIPWQEKNAGDQWVLDLSEFIGDVDNEKSELIISVNSVNSPESVALVGHVLIFQYPKDVNDDFITVTVSDGELEASGSFIVNIKKEKLPPSIWEMIPWAWIFSTIFVATITGFAIYRKKTGYRVFEAFLIHEKGLSVAHASIEQRSEMEDVIVSGMFTAVQDFIADTFSDKASDDWELDEMKFGENKILIERSQKLFLAVIFEGNGDRLRIRVKKLLYDVNREYGSVFSDWKGDMKKVAGINLILMSLISKRMVKSVSSEELLPTRKPEPLVDESQRNLKELDQFITFGTDLSKLKMVENVLGLDDSATIEKCVCAVCGIDVTKDTVICPNCKCKVSESEK